MKNYYSLAEAADFLSVSKQTLRRWDKNGTLTAIRMPNNYRAYSPDLLKAYINTPLKNSVKEESENYDLAIKPYSVLELFAGAGGMALGLEKAGLSCALLNEIDPWACKTLRKNRPDWNVIEGNVRQKSFTQFKEKIEVVTGGFPCQTFSYAGKKLGLNDSRGTLFYEFARVVKEVQPLICIGENVRGLLTHDQGRTLHSMMQILEQLGYDVLTPKILKAAFYKVPQKRERLFLVGIKKGSGITFNYPTPEHKMMNLAVALKAGELFETDVPHSIGQKYSIKKQKIMALVPPGGYWRNLPEVVQKQYMLKSYYLGGGKTGMARRISWDEPCLTLTTSPAQKQTERCHPDYTRPFQIREYARIQTFPDNWKFEGSMNQIYKQIGNAVPVNLAFALGKEIVKSLNAYVVEQELRNHYTMMSKERTEKSIG